MIYIIITILLWPIYCILEGFREGKYFHFRNFSGEKEHQRYDIHTYFAFQRGVVMVLCSIRYEWYVGIPLFFAMSSIFPFFHDGQYYSTRNNIDKKVYPKRWRAFGDGSAKMDFSWAQRVWLLIAGIGLLTLSIFLNEL